jgi:hypothetical protein
MLFHPISQPAVSEMEAHMLACRLWVGGQDVVENSSPAPGMGVAFVCSLVIWRRKLPGTHVGLAAFEKP